MEAAAGFSVCFGVKNLSEMCIRDRTGVADYRVRQKDGSWRWRVAYGKMIGLSLIHIWRSVRNAGAFLTRRLFGKAGERVKP